MGGMGGGGFAVPSKAAPDAGPSGVGKAKGRQATPDTKPALPAAVRAKLAPELRDLARMLATAGTATLRAGNLRVENGQVKIRVKLSNVSDQVLAEMKKLGFQEASRSAAENQVVGTIPVSRLEDLARLQEVQRIEAVQ